MKRLASLAVASFVVASSSLAFASAPMESWVRPTNVELKPDATNPTEIVIHGTFLVAAKPTAGQVYSGYDGPKDGFAYYTCPAGSEAMCKTQWLEIQAYVGMGTDKCIGYGQQMNEVTQVIAEGMPLGTAVPWDLGMGTNTGFTPCQAIADYLKTQGTGGAAGAGGSGAAGDAGAGGATAGAAGAAAGAGGATAGAAGAAAGSGGAATAGAGGASGSGTSGSGTAGSGTSGSGTSGSGTSGSGTSGSGTSGSGTSGSGTSGSADYNGPPPPSDETGGCSFNAGSTSRTALGLGVLGLALLLLRKRS